MESVGSPLVDAVASTAEAVAGERVYRRSATGGGDAKRLRNAGIPTVEFAFGTDTVHAVDEYTTADALAGNAAVYTRLPGALATEVGTGAVDTSKERT
jgi:succinyl-diaminopimelate desuccinylase